MRDGYVHGYAPREGERLEDQARALESLLHGDVRYAPGSRVLEAGCGTGAQTVALARNSPGARFSGLDISAPSLAQAGERVARAGLANVEFVRGDLADPPFPPGSFDHAFVCFVLEHLPDPAATLARIGALLRPGGTVTVIEGDHGSALPHPDHPAAHAAVACQVELQRAAGGDARIGRRLYPLLAAAGFSDVRAGPVVAYADGGDPAMQAAFTLGTFTAMVEGVRERALAAGLATAEGFDAGINALRRAAEPDGTFTYVFYKAVAIRGQDP